MEINTPLLSVSNLKKSFTIRRKGVLSHSTNDSQRIYAVDGVSFELRAGEVLGLIGESGCGKSTTAKLLLKLLSPDEGNISFQGADITAIQGKQLAEYRRAAQMIFQDPYEYLNPRMCVLDCIAEPLVIHKLARTRGEIIEWVGKYLELVGLYPSANYLYRYPHELSGGQRQRIAIARALVMEPKLVIADEPTSMLDVSVRAGILNLLRELKQTLDVSIVFITHDLTTAGYMCDRIAVMYRGRIVESGSRDDIIFNPGHPYSKALVSVAFKLRDFLEGQEGLIKDSEVNSYEKIKNCPFEDRCIQRVEGCDEPGCADMREISPGHYVTCCRC